ncbi:hypothetical protein [Nocardia jejuensis]|uniref:hypothetical protein n=1 Tax=Nocardia jejuensis TaxID=328049 RepID=UPI001FE19FD6|nr:hypothetical protein [Nocardia jejuensis]
MARDFDPSVREREAAARRASRGEPAAPEQLAHGDSDQPPVGSRVARDEHRPRRGTLPDRRLLRRDTPIDYAALAAEEEARSTGARPDESKPTSPAPRSGAGDQRHGAGESGSAGSPGARTGAVSPATGADSDRPGAGSGSARAEAGAGSAQAGTAFGPSRSGAGSRSADPGTASGEVRSGGPNTAARVSDSHLTSGEPKGGNGSGQPSAETRRDSARVSPREAAAPERPRESARPSRTPEPARTGGARESESEAAAREHARRMAAVRRAQEELQVEPPPIRSRSIDPNPPYVEDFDRHPARGRESAARLEAETRPPRAHAPSAEPAVREQDSHAARVPGAGEQSDVAADVRTAHPAEGRPAIGRPAEMRPPRRETVESAPGRGVDSHGPVPRHVEPEQADTRHPGVESGESGGGGELGISPSPISETGRAKRTADIDAPGSERPSERADSEETGRVARTRAEDPRRDSRPGAATHDTHTEDDAADAGRDGGMVGEGSPERERPVRDSGLIGSDTPGAADDDWSESDPSRDRILAALSGAASAPVDSAPRETRSMSADSAVQASAGSGEGDPRPARESGGRIGSERAPSEGVEQAPGKSGESSGTGAGDPVREQVAEASGSGERVGPGRSASGRRSGAVPQGDTVRPDLERSGGSARAGTRSASSDGNETSWGSERVEGDRMDRERGRGVDSTDGGSTRGAESVGRERGRGTELSVAEQKEARAARERARAGAVTSERAPEGQSGRDPVRGTGSSEHDRRAEPGHERARRGEHGIERDARRGTETGRAHGSDARRSIEASSRERGASTGGRERGAESTGRTRDIEPAGRERGAESAKRVRGTESAGRERGADSTGRTREIESAGRERGSDITGRERGTDSAARERGVEPAGRERRGGAESGRESVHGSGTEPRRGEGRTRPTDADRVHLGGRTGTPGRARRSRPDDLPVERSGRGRPVRKRTDRGAEPSSRGSGRKGKGDKPLKEPVAKRPAKKKQSGPKLLDDAARAKLEVTAREGNGIRAAWATFRLHTDELRRRNFAARAERIEYGSVDEFDRTTAQLTDRGYLGEGGGRMAVVGRPVEYRATTAQVAGLWPWSVGAGAPLIGTPLGSHLHTGAPVCFDPMNWFMRGSFITAPSLFVLGLNGFGKSSLVRRIVLGGVAQGITPLILADVKPDYRKLVELVGGQIIDLGYGHGKLNPLAAGVLGAVVPQLDDQPELQVSVLQDLRARQVTLVAGLVELVRGARVRDYEETLIATSLRILYREGSEFSPEHPPIMEDLLTVVVAGGDELQLDAGADNPEEYQNAIKGLRRSLRALTQGPFGAIFNGHTTTPIDTTSTAVCIDVSHIPTGDKKLKAAVMLACWADGFASVEAAHVLADAKLGEQRYFQVVMDELWQVLGLGDFMVDRVDELTRLQRGMATALIMISHTIKDLQALGSEAAIAKALGFLERARAKIFGALPAEEIGRLDSTVPFTSAEQDMVTGWSAPQALTGEALKPGQQRPPAPGTGKFLLKIGEDRRPGIPFHMEFTQSERESGIHDTNQRFSEFTEKTARRGTDEGSAA